jgi:hypothetical protein
MWPEKRSDRLFFLVLGLFLVSMMLFVLVDPRGGFPQGYLMGDDPGYFVPSAVFLLFFGALGILAAAGPRRSQEPWGRA